jgi:uncharacterized protein
MIHSFKFKNFCSFYDTAEMSFANIRKGLPEQNTMFYSSPSGEKLSKVTMLIGANASGKTNALKALTFLGWFASNSFTGLQDEKAEIPLDMFKIPKDKEPLAEFELVFECKEAIYKYILVLNKNLVVKEELYRKESSGHFNYLFKRTWNELKKETEIEDRISIKREVIKDIQRKNVSIISTAVAIKNDVLTEITDHFFKNIITNVSRLGKAWGTSTLVDPNLISASEIYQKNESLFRKAQDFLKDIDLGLERIQIKEANINTPNGEIKKMPLPYGVHKVFDKEFALPLPMESSGTKNMFILLQFLLPVIESGGVAIIDELEIDLHPLALPRIIDLFANPNINNKNSQIIFTSHSLEVLNHLEKEQVILVEKDENCMSTLYRLDELKGIRRDDNLYAKYMAGAYGAVPNI